METKWPKLNARRKPLWSRKNKRRVDEARQNPVHHEPSSRGYGQSQGRAQWGWICEQKLESLWGETPQGSFLRPGLRNIVAGQDPPRELLQNTSLAPLQTHSLRSSRLRPGPPGGGGGIGKLPRWFWCTLRVENHCPKSGLQEWQQDLLHRKPPSFILALNFILVSNARPTSPASNL